MKDLCRLLLSVGFVVLGATVATPALDVYPGTVGGPQVFISISQDESQRVLQDPQFRAFLGGEAAMRMILLCGIPPTTTSKLASFPVAGALTGKYAAEIASGAQRAQGQGFLMSYPVNLDHIRMLWAASMAGDVMMPGQKELELVRSTISLLMMARPR